MKKKFDIIKYIKCYIKMYDDGYYSKTDLIDNPKVLGKFTVMVKR